MRQGKGLVHRVLTVLVILYVVLGFQRFGYRD